MKIILTRHGETKENKEGVLQGWKPGHLSSKGKKQAKLITEKLKDVNINAIYTSDLKRCFDTAKEISKFHKKANFIKEKLIRERSLGEFEGRKVGKSDWDALPGNLYTNRPKGGETFEEVWERLKIFYKQLLKKHPNETILIVGHGGSQCLLQGIIQHKTLKESFKLPKLENTALSEFEINTNGKTKTIVINSKEHLKN
jgi:broad specificity phosphatase PhoE